MKRRNKRYTDASKFLDLLALPVEAVIAWLRRKRKGKR